MSLETDRIDLKELLSKIIPYILIIVASFFAGRILFYKGYPLGDDIAFHFSNIYDMYIDLKNGNISPISDNLASGLGFGKNLFYSPLLHVTTCISAILLESFGISILQALKINLFASIIFSGIIMYHFGLHVSKGKRIPALIASLVYVLYPYRYFDMLCRCALAEAYAFFFLPLFFMGIYDFIHIEDRNKGGMLPCLEIILGGSLLFLTHNITAIYAYFFGMIYLIFNAKKIYYLFKYDKSLIIYAFISCLLLIGLSAKTLLSAYSLYKTGLYNVSNSVRMWTSADYLASRRDFEWYSGLINMSYLIAIKSGITTYTLLIDIFVFIVCTLGVVFIDYLLSKISKLDKYHALISITLGITISIFAFRRTEVLLAIILFNITYLYFVYGEGFKQMNFTTLLILSLIAIIFFITSCFAYKMVMYGIVVLISLGYAVCYTFFKRNKIKAKINTESNMDLYYLVFAHVITLILITVGPIWYIMPSVLRSIQFPWRLFGFLSLFTSILTAEVLKSFNKNPLAIIGTFGASFLLIVNQASIEKDIAYTKYLTLDSDEAINWQMNVDDSLFSDGCSIGACREYFPYMYYYNEKYEPEYSNSIYYQVRRYITQKIFYNTEMNVEPVLLLGSGKVTMTYNKAPRVGLNIKAKEDSLVQIPLIYYPGYKGVITYSDGSSIEVMAKEVDGLVCFDIPKGEYKLETYYEGTTMMKLGNNLKLASIPLTFGFLAWMILFDNKKKILKTNIFFIEE